MARATQPKMDGGLNENYGREILELHTLGVDGGYTQADVGVEVAFAETGGWNTHANQGAVSWKFDAQRLPGHWVFHGAIELHAS